MTTGSVRLDKWLHVARAFKTRSQATRACTLGRVRVNGTVAKPHKAVAVGDRVEVDRRDWTTVLEVLEVRNKPLPKAEAKRLFEDHTPERPKIDPIDRIFQQGTERRERGLGRPTKRERRLTDRLKGKRGD